MKKLWFAVIAAAVLVYAGCGTDDPEEEGSGTGENTVFSISGTTLMSVDPEKCPATFTIPDGVTTVGEGAFSGCTLLKRLDISESVTAIGDNAFVGCTSIEAVVIPDSVETIGDNVFVGCTSIRSVKIPDGVAKIGSNAFSGCDSLVEIRYGGTKAQWADISASAGVPGGVTVYCKDGDVETVGDSSNGDVVGISKPSFKLENTSLYRLTATCVGRDFDAAGGLSDFGYNGSYLYYPLEIDLDKDTAELTAVVIVNEAVNKMGIGLIEVEDDGSVDSYCFATTASSIRYFGGTKAVDKDTGEPKENGWGWKEDSTLGLNKDNKPKLCSVNVPYTFRATLLEKQLTFAIIDSSGTVVGTHNSIDYKTLVNNNGKMYFAIGAISGDTSNIAYSNINVTINGGTCTIDKIENSDGSPFVSIPQYLSVDGTTVTRYRNGVPENLVIPNGVTAIGDWALRECPSKTIVIPDSVKSIGLGAFSNCWKLANVEIPGSVTEIGIRAFNYCSALTSVVIPDGVTKIGEFAFEYCNSLTSISIPNTVTEIGSGAFPNDWDTSRPSKLIIHYRGTTAEWQKIKSYDDKYGKYDEFVISRNITVLCSDTPTVDESLVVQGTTITMRDRDNVPAKLEIPKGITEIGDSAFYWCEQLTDVDLPDSVTKIGRRAFESCRALTGIVIPNNVTEIGVYAFSGCQSLTSMTIPGSVKSIGYNAFPDKWEPDRSSRLVIRYGGTSVEWQKLIENCTYDNEYDSDKYGKYTLSKNTIVLCTDTPTVDESLIVQGTTITMCDGDTVPAKLEISKGITAIGSSAFGYCPSLTSVEIPDSVTKIGVYAFSSCSGLRSMIIPGSVKTIGYNAFPDKWGSDPASRLVIYYGGTSVEWQKLIENRTYDDGYGGCISSDGYAISKYITVLCSDTPTVDESLIVQGTTITMCDGNSISANLAIPDGITEIGYNAFNNCSLLTSVTIPASVTSIGDYAFDWCTNLMSVTYKGTKAQWNAITKGSSWNSSTGNYTITCTDGDINKN